MAPRFGFTIRDGLWLSALLVMALGWRNQFHNATSQEREMSDGQTMVYGEFEAAARDAQAQVRLAQQELQMALLQSQELRREIAALKSVKMQ